jgi:hypothetical protein
MKIILFLVLSLVFYSRDLFSQSIGGIWVGNSKKSLFAINSTKIVLELHLYNDSVLSGVAHMYYKEGKYEHEKISGIFRAKDSSLVFTDDSVISYNYKKGWELCQGSYFMKLTIDSNKLRLTGTWKDKSRGMFHCPTLDTWFEKPIPRENADSLMSAELDESKKSKPETPAYLSRRTDIQKVIEVDSAEKDSIKIEVYDNGIIDNDTVSIYLNDQEIVAQRKISDVPITFFASLDNHSPFQKIKLVAENLGRIPPNTAVVIITTKKNRYEVYSASDYSRNAVIEFFLK